MNRPYWTFGSRFLCIRTDVPDKAEPSYEMVAQVAEPADDPKYSHVGNWGARAEQIAKAMNAHDDLIGALTEAKEAISYAMRGTSDAEQSDKYAATIGKIDDALAKAGA